MATHVSMPRFTASTKPKDRVMPAPKHGSFSPKGKSAHGHQDESTGLNKSPGWGVRGSKPKAM
jgi:hypothetical protein